MSANHICTDCHLPIPAGQAVIRTRSFVRVAYCQPCARDNAIEPVQPWAPCVVPQRVA
jgi:hypothetical protein